MAFAEHLTNVFQSYPPAITEENGISSVLGHAFLMAPPVKSIKLYEIKAIFHRKLNPKQHLVEGIAIKQPSRNHLFLIF